MERIEIIDAVGREYCTSNIEKGEFSYPKAFKEKNLEFAPIEKKKGDGVWKYLDIRFEVDGASLLIETKNDADKWPTVEEQIAAYVEYEKRLTGNKIIAMVANTTDDRITVWKSEVEDDRKLVNEEAIRTMAEYVAMFDAKHANNKEEVMRNTYQLNELLHRYGVGEKLRSQFVGTCLLAIKNGLVYDRKMKTSQIIGGIRTILEDLLEGSLKKAEKLTLIDKRVLKSQDVRDMESENLCLILDFIKDKIFPFINDKSTAGQDTALWQWFKLGGKDGLFDIRKGRRLTAENQTEGDTLYIGAIDSNNGVSNLIGQSPIHAGNTITLSYNGSVGEAFYQPKPYWATDDVNALYLREEYGTLNPATGLFVCSVLKHDRYRYSYGRKWTLENMEATRIKLPATPDGVPDWQWMESYIESLPYGDRL